MKKARQTKTKGNCLPGLANLRGVISDNQEVALTKRFLGDREIESLIEGARKWDEDTRRKR